MSMRSFHAVRRVLMCSQAWAHSTASTTTSIRSMIQIRGNGTLWRPFPFLYNYHSHLVFRAKASSKLLGLQACAGTFLGLLATEQGALVQCDHYEENGEGQDTADLIGEDLSSEKEIKYVVASLVKKFWWPAVFLLTVAVGYPYPLSLLPVSIFLVWSTKPNPATLILLLKKICSTATVMHVEVQDYMLFCVANVTYLTSNATMVGILGDWWVVYSSSSRITALGISLDDVPNLDNIATGFAKDFKTKKEELEYDIRKAAEDGLRRYKEWLDKGLSDDG